MLISVSISVILFGILRCVVFYNFAGLPSLYNFAQRIDRYSLFCAWLVIALRCTPHFTASSPFSPLPISVYIEPSRYPLSQHPYWLHGVVTTAYFALHSLLQPPRLHCLQATCRLPFQILALLRRFQCFFEPHYKANRGVVLHIDFS